MRLKYGEKPKFLIEIETYNILYKNKNLKYVKDKWIFYWRFLSYLFDMGYRLYTIQNYYYILRRFLNMLQDKPIRKINKEDVAEYLLYLKNDCNYKPYTLRYSKEKIHYYFTFIMRYSRIKKNPTANLNIRLHYKQEENMDLFTQDEVELIIKKNKQCLKRIQRSDFKTDYSYRLGYYNIKQDYLILKLMFSSGIRPCEVVNIELPDFYAEELKLRIRSKGNQQYIMKDRHIFITKKTSEEIDELLKIQESLRNIHSEQKLFIHYSGHKLSNNYPTTIIKRRASKSGIKRRVYAYMTRYTYCTGLVENGIDLYSLKCLMGHKQVAVTLKHYLKLSPTEIRKEWKQFNPLNKGA